MLIFRSRRRRRSFRTWGLRRLLPLLLRIALALESISKNLEPKQAYPGTSQPLAQAPRTGTGSGPGPATIHIIQGGGAWQ